MYIGVSRNPDMAVTHVGLRLLEIAENALPQCHDPDVMPTARHHGHKWRCFGFAVEAPRQRDIQLTCLLSMPETSRRIPRTPVQRQHSDSEHARDSGKSRKPCFLA